MEENKVKIYDEVIADIIHDLDAQHATYQTLHRKYHGGEDQHAKHNHQILIELCKRIRKEISLRERK